MRVRGEDGPFNVTLFRGFNSEEEKSDAEGPGLAPIKPLTDNHESPVATLSPAAILAIFAPNVVIRHVANIRKKKLQFRSFSERESIAKCWATSTKGQTTRRPGYLLTVSLELKLLGKSGRANPVYRCQNDCLWLDTRCYFPQDPNAFRTEMDNYKQANKQNTYSFSMGEDNQDQELEFILNNEWPVAEHKAKRDEEMLLAHGPIPPGVVRITRVEPPPTEDY